MCPTPAATRSISGSGRSQDLTVGESISCAATTTFPALAMERANSPSSAGFVASTYSTSSAMTFGCAAAIASMARAAIFLGQGNGPSRAMLGSSIATMAISPGACPAPRIDRNQSHKK